MKNINKSLFSKLQNSHSFNISFIYLDNYNNQPLDVLENIMNELKSIIKEMNVLLLLIISKTENHKDKFKICLYCYSIITCIYLLIITQ